MDFFLNKWLSFSFPTIFAQDTSISLKFFNPKSINSTTFIIFLIGLLTVIVGLSILTVQYKRWRNFNTFLNEMRSLDLDPTTEGTFAWMVKRYHMNEPVKVLQSARAFDEMASDEILRVLCSAGSVAAKEDFIDTVYDIRNRTFHPDRFLNEESLQ